MRQEGCGLETSLGYRENLSQANNMKQYKLNNKTIQQTKAKAITTAGGTEKHVKRAVFTNADVKRDLQKFKIIFV